MGPPTPKRPRNVNTWWAGTDPNPSPGPHCRFFELEGEAGHDSRPVRCELAAPRHCLVPKVRQLVKVTARGPCASPPRPAPHDRPPLRAPAGWGCRRGSRSAPGARWLNTSMPRTCCSWHPPCARPPAGQGPGSPAGARCDTRWSTPRVVGCSAGTGVGTPAHPRRAGQVGLLEPVTVAGAACREALGAARSSLAAPSMSCAASEPRWSVATSPGRPASPRGGGLTLAGSGHPFSLAHSRFRATGVAEDGYCAALCSVIAGRLGRGCCRWLP